MTVISLSLFFVRFFPLKVYYKMSRVVPVLYSRLKVCCLQLYVGGEGFLFLQDSLF